MAQLSPNQQPPVPHAPTIAGAPSQVTPPAVLVASTQTQRAWDLTKSHAWSYVPSWSHPQWKPGFRFVSDGDRYILTDRLPGDSIQTRPALLLGDDANMPSLYARRFGMRPRQGARDQWAHSSMTPTLPVFQTSEQAPQADDYDRSLQSITFNGYTAAELAEQGAYNPLITGTPIDLDDENAPINSLFAKTKWTQVPQSGKEKWSGSWDVRYGKTIDGTGMEGLYDVHANPKVWSAIEPALRLASKVIESDHPFWMAITNIHNYRPVDASKDGRTDEQKTKEGGVPYTSVWMNPDDDRAPAPYAEMANLKARGFDGRSARTQCLRILNTYLTFSIFQEGQLGGMTRIQPDDDNNDFSIRICLAASLIWPLLLPQHLSESERVSYTFVIANAMLHELAHAVVAAQRILFTKDNLLRGFLSDDIIRSLMTLGDQVGGPRVQWYYGGGTWRFGQTYTQTFTEDAVQGEDGLNLEKEIWGFRVLPHPMGGDFTFNLKPYVSARNWPGVATQPFQQGNSLEDQRGSAYQRFLTSPNAHGWNEFFAVPIAWYARYMQPTWWTYIHQKYGHQGLRLAAEPQSTAPNTIPRRVVVTETDAEILDAVMGQDLVKWLRDTVVMHLERAGQIVMAAYIQALQDTACEISMLHTRSIVEEASWATKLQQLDTLANQVQTSYVVMYNHMNTASGALSPLTIPFTPLTTALQIQRMNDLLRPTMQAMMTLSTALTQETAYQQNIIAMHLHVEHPHFRQLLHTHITTLRARIVSVANLLTGRTLPLILATAQPVTESENWGWALQQKMIADLLLAPNNGNPAGMPAALAALPAAVTAQALQFLALLDDIAALHRTFTRYTALLAQNHAAAGIFQADGSLVAPAAPPVLQAVVRQRQTGALRALGPAAIREMSRLPEGPLSRLVSEALRRLAAFFEDGIPEQLAVGADARRARLTAGVRLVLMNEAQARWNRLRAAGADDPLAEVGGAGVGDVDATPEELLTRILDLATVAADRGSLAAWWSLERIQTTVNEVIAAMPPP